MGLEKRILITGASSGIGKAAAKQLAEKGNEVIMLCRNKEKTEGVIKELGYEIKYVVCDLADLDDVRRAAKNCKENFGSIDILINNAGAVFADRKVSKLGHELTFTINHLSHFLLTNKLSGIVKERIINISSCAHKLSKMDLKDINLEKSYSSLKAYSQSKLANILFTYELARRNSSITANCVDPGFVRTDVGQNDKKSYVSHIMKAVRPFFKGAEKGAETITYLALSDDVKNVTGKYFRNKKIKKSSKRSHDKSLAAGLWALSEKMTGL